MPSTVPDAKDGEINGMISILEVIHFRRHFHAFKKESMHEYIRVFR